MKILSVYPHYRPDSAPYMRILSAILEHLASQGHDVHVMTAQPSYNDNRLAKQPRRETLDGVYVRRIRTLPGRKKQTLVRAFNFVWLMFRAILHVLRRRDYDLIIANTYPPLLMGQSLRLLRRLTGTAYIYHCQDIHPESAAVVGKLPRGRRFDWLQKLDTRVCNEAALVIVLSNDMRETLIERGVNGANIRVMNNFVSTVAEVTVDEVPEIVRDNDDSFTVFFAGNMGSFQGLDRVVAAFHELTDVPKIRLIFMGAGDQCDALKQQAAELINRSIHFLPFQPAAVAYASMQRADLGLVTLQPGIHRVAYPSKSMMYLSAGCPLLTVVESESSICQTVRDHEIGYAADDGAPKTIAATIRRAFEDSQAGTFPRRHNIVQKSNELFGLERTLQAWTGFVDAAVSSPNKEPIQADLKKAA